MVCCYHSISDDLVLNLDWKIVEWESAVDLIVFIGKQP